MGIAALFDHLIDTKKISESKIFSKHSHNVLKPIPKRNISMNYFKTLNFENYTNVFLKIHSKSST